MSQTSIARDEVSDRRPKHLETRTRTGAGLDALAEAVAAMHHAFSAHVAHQEGACGFFSFMVTAAPRYHTMLEHLRVEHHHLARSVASLRIRVHRAQRLGWDEARWVPLLAEADAIGAAISEHDELEREMLVDGLDPR